MPKIPSLEKTMLNMAIARLADKTTDQTRLIKELKVLREAPDDLLKDSREMVDRLIDRAIEMLGVSIRELQEEAIAERQSIVEALKDKESRGKWKEAKQALEEDRKGDS